MPAMPRRPACCNSATRRVGATQELAGQNVWRVVTLFSQLVYYIVYRLLCILQKIKIFCNTVSIIILISSKCEI
jgi:hypothetical protein